MQFIAEKAQVVAKRQGTYKNSGEAYYQISLSNGLGGIFTADCPADIYGQAQPLGPKYSVVINMETNGYKHYCNIEELYEEAE